MVFGRNGMFAMVTRTQVLKRFKLPVRKTFDIRSEKDDYGIWRIVFTSKGNPPLRMLPSAAALLAEELRAADTVLAGKIDDCARQPQRYFNKPV